MSVNGLETTVGGAANPLNLSEQGKKVDGQIAVAEGKVTAHNGPHDFMAGMAAAALSSISPTLSVFVGAVAAAMSGTKSHFAQTSEHFKEILTKGKKRIEPIPMGSELPKQPAAPKPPVSDIFSRSKIASASLKAIKGAKIAAQNIASLKRERDAVQKLKEGLNRFDNLNRAAKAAATGSKFVQSLSSNVKQTIVKNSPALKSRLAQGIKV